MLTNKFKTFALAALAACFGPLANAQALNAAVAGQMGSLLQEKEQRTPAQQKIGSQLWYSLQAARGQALGGMPSIYGQASDNRFQAGNAPGMVTVMIRGTGADRVKSQIAAVGGTVRYASARSGSILATVPLASLETLAASSDVSRIAPAPMARTNVGAITSQAYISHKANQVVSAGIDGTGVRVGVLSDSANIAALISSGDLPADTVIVPGQAGSGESEGSAMMEIVHDIAPGAKLFFATAFTSEDSFADNIRTLRNTYNCDIIVDDVSYFDEGAFQDGEIAQAVNDVTASGALYFSSAANSGNLTSGTSGTWEGDFSAGSASAAPLPTGYTLHNFGGGQTYDVLTVATQYIFIHWSDPLGAATDDYDLFVLNAAGTTVLCASTDVQSVATPGDPIEGCYSGTTAYPVGSRIVIGKKAGAATLALHVDTERGALSIATSGATFGHNAGKNTVSMAATFWNSAKTGAKPFVGGAANPTETFSSDGPRRIFFQPDGTPLTPGNFLFGTNGGTLLQKPDLTAADGVFTMTPGFLPFFGTSAAAPHAAAIAALVKAARPDYTNAQILAAMKATALDIRAAGVDRDSGYGITMAKEAVAYALSH